MTSAGRAYEKTDGTVIPHKHLRYICYNRTQHRHLCDGQTGYASKTIDDCVEGILLEVFGRLKNIPNDGIIEKQYADRLKETESSLGRLKKLLSNKTSELADIKGEVVKVIRGASTWDMELLNELITSTTTEITTIQSEIDIMQDEYEDTERLYTTLQNQYRSYLDWAGTFAASELGVKKMIASHIIGTVKVSRGNHIEICFNISLEQFLGDTEQIEALS